MEPGLHRVVKALGGRFPPLADGRRRDGCDVATPYRPDIEGEYGCWRKDADTLVVLANLTCEQIADDDDAVERLLEAADGDRGSLERALERYLVILAAPDREHVEVVEDVFGGGAAQGMMMEARHRECVGRRLLLALDKLTAARGDT